MSNILTVFDLDHTLAIPDVKKDLEHNFLTIDHLTPIPEMMQLLDQSPEKMILTNRHPMLKTILEEKYQCPVICRNFCLSQSEMEKVNTSYCNLQKFLKQMIIWKTTELNALAKQYNKIIFYDDYARNFQRQHLHKNIDIRLPLHMQNTQLSDFLIDT